MIVTRHADADFDSKMTTQQNHQSFTEANPQLYDQITNQYKQCLVQAKATDSQQQCMLTATKALCKPQQDKVMSEHQQCEAHATQAMDKAECAARALGGIEKGLDHCADEVLAIETPKEITIETASHKKI